MSATVRAIHTLLVTLSSAELCEVIQRSAELCAELAQKNPSVIPVPLLAPAPLLAPTRLKRPTSNPATSDEPDGKHDIPTRFANLLGWGDSEEESDLSMCGLQRSDNADDLSDEKESDECSTDPVKKRRMMKMCFTDGQRIRHMIRGKMWIGVYDSAKNAIIHNGVAYRTITLFATTHVLTEHNPKRATPRDGWKNCQCEVKGEWVSTYDLPC